MEELITLDYGSGGKKTSELIENILLPQIGNDKLSELGDGAIVEGFSELVFSTDSFVVSPLFFPGGDIGKLSVCGTVNDISVCGATAKYLSLAFIIEEGLPFATLKKIVNSISNEAKKAGVIIVTGDTKVVERGKADGIFINTSGIGFLKHKGLSPKNIKPGDAVILSGTAGDHGAAVMLARGDMLKGEINSDCASLNELCSMVLDSGAGVRVLRDPTRGGVATTLNEFIENTDLGIEIFEDKIPIAPKVEAACEILGLDPLYSANEGKILAIVSADTAEKAVSAMRKTKEGKNAQIIGKVTEENPGKLILRTKYGGGRILQKLSGAQLPRIC
ncbi:MAG: hydrogenase expression/formation protein HypE [Ruminococcaceae bacterium]|nr:hydrogenase expression/formation protein HypE [Oscillospiraceae bacterium]